MGESIGEYSSGISVVVPSVGNIVSVIHITRNFLFFRDCSDSVTLGAAVTFSVKSEPEYALKSVDALDEGSMVVVGSGLHELI